MVLSRPGRYRHRRHLPCSHPEDQPRPALVSAILKKQTLCLFRSSPAPTPPRTSGASPPPSTACFTASKGSGASRTTSGWRPSRCKRPSCPIRSSGSAALGSWTWRSTGPNVRRHAALRRADALPQVLRIAIPRKGRALPLLQLAYDRDRLPPRRSQNRLEQDAPLAVVEALPSGVRPVVLADRGFCRASFVLWLEYQNLDHVVRLAKGTCITEPDGAGGGSWGRRGSSRGNCGGRKGCVPGFTTDARESYS
jgi:hypothetical protein